MKKISVLFAVLILASVLASSCSSHRKCTGRKGIKTPMGTM